jgi:hypothetical protein
LLVFDANPIVPWKIAGFAPLLPPLLGCSSPRMEGFIGETS